MSGFSGLVLGWASRPPGTQIPVPGIDVNHTNAYDDQRVEDSPEDGRSLKIPVVVRMKRWPVVLLPRNGWLSRALLALVRNEIRVP